MWNEWACLGNQKSYRNDSHLLNCFKLREIRFLVKIGLWAKKAKHQTYGILRLLSRKKPASVSCFLDSTTVWVVLPVTTVRLYLVFEYSAYPQMQLQTCLLLLTVFLSIDSQLYALKYCMKYTDGTDWFHVQ